MEAATGQAADVDTGPSTIALAKTGFAPKLQRWWPAVYLAGYAVLIGVAVSRHEPWFDEAQAWLIARDSNPVTLLTRHLPYEGHPPLWYLLIMLPAKYLPYWTINVISAALAFAAAYVVVRHSPFPVVVKVLLPLGFFLFFQYGVVARNYALLGVLIFLVAKTYSERFERPYLFAALLFALANVSAYAYVLTGVVAAVTTLELLRDRRSLPRPAFRKTLVATAALGAGMAALAWLMWPPSDRTFATTSGRITENALGRAGDIFASGMAGRNLFTIAALLATTVLFWKTRTLSLYLASTFALMVFAAIVYGTIWHQGTMFLTWVLALWIAFERLDWSKTDEKRIGTVALAAVVGISGLHVVWSGAAFVADVANPYSGSEALANYIENHGLQSSTIYGINFPSVAVNPYFGRNILANYHEGTATPSFWWWSTNNGMRDSVDAILAGKPDYVIVPIKFPGWQQTVRQLHGYEALKRFDGMLYWKMGPVEADGYLLMRRIEAG
ncbi:MAG TPA: hypothetical protein VHJ78_01875 [Actinomycetota bacterium]|nr:hypothetical protein [Actinomycetota bacterium]